MQDDSVITAVVDGVAKDKGVDPTELPPLHDTIDPDALEALIATGATDGSIFFVEFEFAGRLVTIDGTEVSVRAGGDQDGIA